MSGLSCGGMEPDEPNKDRKVDDEVMSFLLKRSEHDIPQYSARIRTYLDVKRRRQRANEVRRNTENEKTKKKAEADTKEINEDETAFMGNDDDRMSKRSRREKVERARPESRGQEPVDGCCRRRRRKRSCRRRRRRRGCRRSCSRRRRRRSCSRRRRRRSCRCRRRKCRRCKRR